MLRILAFVAIAFLITNCTSTKTEEVKPEEKFISFDGDQFKISFPSEWIDATQSNPNVNFVVVAPPDDKTDEFTENASVVIQAIGDTIDAKDYLDLSVSQLNQYMPEHTMIDKRVMKKNGTDCVRLEYQGNTNNRDLRFLQDAYIKDGKAYLVTFTAEEIIFREYRNTAESILSSFKIK